VNVRFGSLADIHPKKRDVRFTTKSGRRLSLPGRPLCAKSRHQAPSIVFAASNQQGSKTTLVTPSQDMKLRQHGRRKPTVRCNHANKPSEPGEQIVDFSFLSKWPASRS
jgi:hypothetical protein